MSGLIVLLFFAAFLIWGVWADSRSEKRKRDEAKTDSKEWLEKQKLFPRWRVHVRTKTSKHFDTKAFEPVSWVEYWGRLGCIVEDRSSKDLALAHIENCVKLDRFHDEFTDTFIPMCEIEHLQVKEVK